MALMPAASIKFKPTTAFNPSRPCHLADRFSKPLSIRHFNQALRLVATDKASKPTTATSATATSVGYDSSKPIAIDSSSSSSSFDPYTSITGEGAAVDPCSDPCSDSDFKIISAPILEYWYYPGTVLIISHRRSDLEPIDISFKDDDFDWHWDILPNLTVLLAYKVWPPFRLTALDTFGVLHLVALCLALLLYITIE